MLLLQRILRFAQIDPQGLFRLTRKSGSW